MIEESSDTDQRFRISSIDLPRNSEGVATAPMAGAAPFRGTATPEATPLVVCAAPLVEQDAGWEAVAAADPNENPPAGFAAA